MARFPSIEWVKEYSQKLNESKSYEEAARTWEGDFLFVVTPDEGLDKEYFVYLDLWRARYFLMRVGVSAPTTSARALT
jgi:hypothetical protein